MAPSSKATATAKERRKSEKLDKASEKLVVHLKVGADRLKAIVSSPSPAATKESTPTKDSPATATSAPAALASNPSDSTPNTPANGGTPVPQQSMGPPTEGPKKKGTKRGAAALDANGEPTSKPKGKPGPKKRQRLEDGTLEPTRAGLSHKLGPKANQGAINAGLRALDRSGKPCRKWNKGGFKLKSFTGVVWEINRWTAPPKPKPDVPAETSTPASTEGSNKENKETEQIKSENSNSGGDVEMRSVSSVPASSPAPTPALAPTAIAAAS